MSIKMTEFQKINYLQNSGACPFCFSEDLVGESFEVSDEDQVEQVVSCSNCGEAWFDIYKLHDVQQV